MSRPPAAILALILGSCLLLAATLAGCAASAGSGGDDESSGASAAASGRAGTARGRPGSGRQSGQRVKVLTWAIDRGRGSDGELDLDRIARAISRSGADLVALQEVDWRTARSGGVDQPATIAKSLGYQHAYAEAVAAEGGSHGEALLARQAFGEARRIPLAAPAGQEPTVAVEVSVAPWGERGERIRFISTRLSPESATTRLRQVATLKSSLEGHPSPAILAGSFATPPGSGPYRLLAEGWVDAAHAAAAATGGEAAPTYPAGSPESRPDLIFLRPAERWRVVSARVLEEPLASGHRPLLVELELLPEGAGQ